jgi:hypothetical protein
MLMGPVGFIPVKGCAGDARQKLRTIDPTSCAYPNYKNIKL